MTREQAIEHGKTQLEVFGGEHREFIKLALQKLQEETVSKEDYDHEYFLRKELDLKVAKLEKQIAEQKSVLDKVRAEIEQNAYLIVVGVNNHVLGMTLYGILQVIDKYKLESELNNLGIPTGSIHCQHTDAEIAKSFIEDVAAVKDQLPGGDQMDFPNTFDEFAKDYGFKDKDEVYTNGSELIPVFRVRQWLEHISTAKNNLAVEDEERTLALLYLEQIKEDYIEGEGYERHPLPEYYAIEKAIKTLAMPLVTPQKTKTENDFAVDPIDRVELLRAMDTWDKFGFTTRYGLERLDKDDKGFVPYVKYDDMLKCVTGMPSVTLQEPRWIPVSEKLPNDRDWYLGIFKEHDTGWINPLPFICDYVGHETKATTKEHWILRGFTDMDEHIDYYLNLECVAWMPLPKSYKAESEDKK